MYKNLLIFFTCVNVRHLRNLDHRNLNKKETVVKYLFKGVRPDYLQTIY